MAVIVRKRNKPKNPHEESFIYQIATYTKRKETKLPTDRKETYHSLMLPTRSEIKEICRTKAISQTKTVHTDTAILNYENMTL